MPMKDYFLEEIREGDYVTVTVRVGDTNMTATGTVVMLTPDMLRLKTVDGSPRLPLDSLVYYDTPEKPSEHVRELKAEKTSQLDPTSMVKTEEPKPVAEEVRTQATSGVPLLMELCRNVVPLNVQEVANWENLKALPSDSDWPKSVANEWRNITSTFSGILKQMPMGAGVLDDKMRNVASKIHRMMTQYPEEENTISGLIASMYFQVEDYVRAEKFYERSEDYQGAVYAAIQGKHEEHLDYYLDQYVGQPGQLDPYLYVLYAQSAYRRKSLMALSRRVAQLRTQGVLEEQDYDEMEHLSLCAFTLCRESSLPLQWAITYTRPLALTGLERFIKELPEGWEHTSLSAEDGAVSLFGQTSVSQTEYISTIVDFHINGLFGYIFDRNGNRFFHVDQVNKEDQLREALAYDGLPQNLEVSYKLGKAFRPDKPPAAYDVRLTPRGAEEARRRLERKRQDNISGKQVLYGILLDYDRDTSFGHILADGKSYNVNHSGIVDPYLKTYLERTYQDICDIRVAFYPGEDRKGKGIAKQVFLTDESDMVFSDDIQYMIHTKLLTQNDFDWWPDRKKKLLAAEDTTPTPENLYLRPYTPLEPVEILTQRQSVSSSETIVSPTPEHTTADLPVPEPLPDRGANQFAGLTPLEGTYYDMAHKYFTNGQFTTAEELFIRALRAGDRPESAIADLVTLYLRDASRVPDAIDLLEAYGHELPEDKRINLQLQIYQKIPERPYRIKLCHLLNEVVERPIRTSAKLHYLSLQGNTLRALGEYHMALNSYKRWHQLYNAEVQYRGSAVVTQYAIALNAVHRSEAICQYMLGNKPKAERLAKELLRISATDETARKILDGTLDKDAADAENTSGIVSDEEIRLGEAEQSNFATDRLENIQLSKYMKSYALDNGEYSGDRKKAEEDINFLLRTPGQTPSIRGERLLCAAKIVAAVDEQQRAKKSSSGGFRPGTKETYIARSMAAYGDSVLIAQQEQDTARYAYLQAIEVLNETETDWKKSLSHYVSSYFLGKQDIAQVVNSNNRTGQPRLDGISPINNNHPQDTGEFIIGMLKLRKALNKAKSSMSFQIPDIIRRSVMIDDVVRWLDENGIETNYNTSDSFRRALERVDVCVRDTEQKIGELMDRLPDHFLSTINSEDILVQLRDAKLRSWLCFTDRNYLDRISTMLEEFRSYFNIRDFQHRSSRYDKAIQQNVDLIQNITDNPTQLSYDVLRPALIKLRQTLEKSREKHFLDLPPELHIVYTEGVAPYLNNGEVRVHLTIRNGNFQSRGDERQLADNIELKVTEVSKGVDYVRIETDMSGCVYGGKEREAILIFRIWDDQILSLGSFDVKVECAYRYNELPTKVAEGSAVFDEPVVFRRGHSTGILNPYHRHVGHEMADDDMFKGRDEIIRKMLDTMCDNGVFNYGHGIMLYGQTRAGKSSIRIHFTKQVRAKYPRVIQVDLKNLNDGSAANEQAFYTSFLDVLDTELATHHPDMTELMSNRGITTPSHCLMEMENHPNAFKRLFTSYLRRLDMIVRENGKMILLVADEFSAINTAIQKGQIPEEFMQTWKALMENYGLFSVCFGQDDTPLFVAKNENAFRRMEMCRVTYLDEESAKELMDKPVTMNGKSRYTAATLDELYELTSGSAYLIIKVCDLLVEYLNNKGAENVTPGILQNFLSTRVFTGAHCIEEGDFEPQLGDRSDETVKEINKQLLLDIARNSEINGWAERSDLSTIGLEPREGQSPERRLNELLMRLEERDVIEVKENRYYRIKVALLNRYLLAKYGRR